MERTHPNGVFHRAVRCAARSLQFPYHGSYGSVTEQEDLYRFPTVAQRFRSASSLEGTNYEGYNSLGAHPATVKGVPGTRFAVWAPNAIVVRVVGELQRLGFAAQSDARSHRRRLGDFHSGRRPATPYKYAVKSRFRGYSQMKADPYGFGPKRRRSQRPSLRFG